MKLKVVVVDLELSRRQKIGLAVALSTGLAVLGASVALSAPPHAFQSGAVLKAADLNENFKDADDRITALEGDLTTANAAITALEAKTHDPSAFRAFRTTAQNIPHGTPTKLVFDSELFDLANEYNPTTGFFTAASAGTYLVHCAMWLISPAGAGPVWAITVDKNGTQLASSDWQSAAAKGFTPAIDGLIHLNAGDQISCVLYQDTGATQSTNPAFPERTTFSAARIY
jgi:hypothetical protein